MLSIDANILLHAFNQDSPRHPVAFRWLTSIQSREDVAISEFVLAEFYVLLRNPAVLDQPLSSSAAVEVIRVYRCHPRWRLIGFASESRALHDRLWVRAGGTDFAFRRLFDVRTALSMLVQGVTELATANVAEFADLGFARVWNPLEAG